MLICEICRCLNLTNFLYYFNNLGKASGCITDSDVLYVLAYVHSFVLRVSRYVSCEQSSVVEGSCCYDRSQHVDSEVSEQAAATS